MLKEKQKHKKSNTRDTLHRPPNTLVNAQYVQESILFCWKFIFALKSSVKSTEEIVGGGEQYNSFIMKTIFTYAFTITIVRLKSPNTQD